MPGWLSSDDDKWFRIDINKSIARQLSFGYSLYINETISWAIRPRVRAKALPGEKIELGLLGSQRIVRILISTDLERILRLPYAPSRLWESTPVVFLAPIPQNTPGKTNKYDLLSVVSISNTVSSKLF